MGDGWGESIVGLGLSVRAVIGAMLETAATGLVINQNPWVFNPFREELGDLRIKDISVVVVVISVISVYVVVGSGFIVICDITINIG